ncbi:MAG: superoxide dismutase family protein [candidate division NC10 bacterium]|nr:superoxide dismutase family protein [candidate division NC10 bacterium]MBI2455789.1 superoxide dismutase family protein [candidate division NC10 bacterium]
MKRLWIVLVGVLFAGCATLPYARPQATADLKNAKGDVVGTAALWEDEGGVRVFAEVRGLPPGRHGIHLHAVGKCDPPEFATAGAHFNPEGKKHGLANPQGPHAGDLPNLDVAADGTGQVHYLARRVTLAPGPASLLDADGTAVVVHAGADDHVTDPTGNSGGRIACGVIQKAP